MSLKRLKEIVPNLKYNIKNGVITELDFTGFIFGSQIRHSSHKREIVEIINQFSDLKKLNLRKSRLGELVYHLDNLHNLTHLDLGSNYIGSFPEFLFKYSKLEYLNLGVNDIKEIHGWLPNLKVFKIHKNPIKNIPCISDQIQDLNIYLCYLKEIPNWVYDLDLINLSCGACPFKYISIPWKNIEWLSIVSTYLTELPEDICFLKKLRGLRLSKNRLYYLPDYFGNLTSLKELSLYNNRLCYLPISFDNLKLNKLNLAKNNIENLSLVDRSELAWHKF